MACLLLLSLPITVNDPLAGSAWSAASTVDGFCRSTANANLLAYAGRLGHPLRIADIGCGAGRNAIPLAATGAAVIAVDLSLPMIRAARARANGHRLATVLAPMDALPVRDHSIDLIIAHGIWNLARSDSEWRAAVREAARIAAPLARLFVFTFSRHTISPGARPLPGQQYVFTDFAGSPQVFMTAAELIDELHRVGFEPDPDLALREHNLPPPGQQRIGGAPVIYEGGFIFKGA